MPTATINAPFPNRVALYCAPLTGPFTHPVFGGFDCTRDIGLWFNGVVLRVTSFTFDANLDRYLMYTPNVFLSGNPVVDAASVLQIVHHVPNPPFMAGGSPPNLLAGFALIAAYSQTGP